METTGKINIAGALHSISDDGIVVYTGDVYDTDLQKTQAEINKEISGGGDIQALKIRDAEDLLFV